MSNYLIDINAGNLLNNFVNNHNMVSIGRKFDVYIGDGVHDISDFDPIFKANLLYKQFYLITNIVFRVNSAAWKYISYIYNSPVISATIFTKQVFQNTVFIDTKAWIVSFVIFPVLGLGDIVEFNYISLLTQ